MYNIKKNESLLPSKYTLKYIINTCDVAANDGSLALSDYFV